MRRPEASASAWGSPGDRTDGRSGRVWIAVFHVVLVGADEESPEVNGAVQAGSSGVDGPRLFSVRESYLLTAPIDVILVARPAALHRRGRAEPPTRGKPDKAVAVLRGEGRRALDLEFDLNP